MSWHEPFEEFQVPSSERQSNYGRRFGRDLPPLSHHYVFVVQASLLSAPPATVENYSQETEERSWNLAHRLVDGSE